MPKYCECCSKPVYKKGARYNHMFSIAFSVDSMFDDGDDCLRREADEVIAKLLERVSDIVREGHSGFEAFGVEDTYEIFPEDHAKNA